MQQLPPELWAHIACFAGEDALGCVARTQACTVRIKHRNSAGQPCVNGLLHSWDGREPIYWPVAINGKYTVTEWRLDGKLHRDGDLPAQIYQNGSQKWYQHGLLHRDNDQPAMIVPGGDRAWYQRGQRHRNVYPAIIASNGYRAWYRHGELRLSHWYGHDDDD
jgi:hypothetical protein